jgi:hypothetical protein
MEKHKQRQALAVSARLSTQVVSLPGFPGHAALALEEEAAKVFAASEEKRMNGGASGHIVLSNGRVSGYLKDGQTLVQFAGGQAAFTTHD